MSSDISQNCEPSAGLQNCEHSVGLQHREPSAELQNSEPSAGLQHREPSAGLQYRETFAGLQHREPSAGLQYRETSTGLQNCKNEQMCHHGNIDTVTSKRYATNVQVEFCDNVPIVVGDTFTKMMTDFDFKMKMHVESHVQKTGLLKMIINIPAILEDMSTPMDLFIKVPLATQCDIPVKVSVNFHPHMAQYQDPHEKKNGPLWVHMNFPVKVNMPTQEKISLAR